MCKAYGQQFLCDVCSALSTVYFLRENAVACDQARQAGPKPRMGGGCGSFEAVVPEHPVTAICLYCRNQGLHEPESIAPLSPVFGRVSSEDTVAFRRVIALAEDSCKAPATVAKGVDQAAQQVTVTSAKEALDRVIDSQNFNGYLAAYHATNAAPSPKAVQSAAPPTAAVPTRTTRSRTPRTSSPPVVEAKVKATRSPAARKTPASAVQTSTKATKTMATRSAAAPAIAAPASAPRGRKRKSSEDISEAKRLAPDLRRSARNAGK